MNGKNSKNINAATDVDNYFHYLYKHVALDGPEDNENVQELLSKILGNRIHEWVQGQQGNVAAAATLGVDGQLVEPKFL